MDIYLSVTVFIIGAIFGSFVNVCIFRIPEKKSIINPPSHCYNCKTRLKVLDLIPILSFMLLRGKCRYCGRKVSVRYALVELLTGVIFTLICSVYGYNIITIYYLALVALLIIITFIDIDHYIIPDELIVFGFIVAIVFNILGKGIEIKDSLLGGLICGVGILLLIYLIEFIVKKEVMGGGDIKLFAMIGLFLGIQGGLLTILLSIYVGGIYGLAIIIYSKVKKGKYNPMIPYGPFIAIAALIVLLFRTDIINWYIGIL